jgi:hypothetical protein
MDISHSPVLRKKEEYSLRSPGLTASDLTFYHYKLIRRVSLRPETKYSYRVTALLLPLACLGVYGVSGLLMSIGAALVMLLVHAVVVRYTLKRVDKLAEKRWAFRHDWPWIGPLPVQDTRLGLFRKLQYHLLLVGCCVTGLLYPWSPSALIIALLYWHLWLLFPRLKIMLTLRRQKGSGIIRLSSEEVSYYHQ